VRDPTSRFDKSFFLNEPHRESIQSIVVPTRHDMYAPQRITPLTSPIIKREMPSSANEFEHGQTCLFQPNHDFILATGETGQVINTRPARYHRRAIAFLSDRPNKICRSRLSIRLLRSTFGISIPSFFIADSTWNARLRPIPMAAPASS